MTQNRRTDGGPPPVEDVVRDILEESMLGPLASLGHGPRPLGTRYPVASQPVRVPSPPVEKTELRP